MKRALILIAMSFAARAAADPTSVPEAPRLEAPRGPVQIPPIVIAPDPPKPPIDKRPFLLAGGVLVLAAIFIWNRDRARKLEAEHGATPPRQRRWRVKPDADDADDSQELADAARDPATDDPEEKP